MGVIDRDEGLDRLRAILKSMGKVAIAYSGGADSSLILRVARDELVEKVLAITVSCDLMPSSELECALTNARTMGIEPSILIVDVLAMADFRNNSPDRCYICKRAIFSAIAATAKARGYSVIIDGSHAEDLDSDRPGKRALRELGVRSPLSEAGLNKADVRRLSKQLGIGTADKPANPCLATRIPFHQQITLEKLKQIDQAERAVRELGIKEVRVRHHGAIARIEVLPADLTLVVAHREDVVSDLKKIGFVYVVLDLQGFRSGSMSEELASKWP